MPLETPVDKNSPLWKAWEAYEKTEEYANSFKWAGSEEHRQGSLWAVFLAGWLYSREAQKQNPSEPRGLSETQFRMFLELIMAVRDLVPPERLKRIDDLLQKMEDEDK